LCRSAPGTQTADRLHKPAEYAAAGIEHYWRVETLPEVAVHTYRLADSGSYVASGVFTEGDTISAPGLPWAKIGISNLTP
jgi:Uma2 family endonuclease